MDKLVNSYYRMFFSLKTSEGLTRTAPWVSLGNTMLRKWKTTDTKDTRYLTLSA